MTDPSGPPAPPVFRPKPLGSGVVPPTPPRLVASTACWLTAAVVTLGLAVVGRDLLDPAAAALYDRLIAAPSADPSQTDALHEIANNGPMWLTYAQLVLGVGNLLAAVLMTGRRSLSARTILVLTGTVTAAVSVLFYVVMLSLPHSDSMLVRILAGAQLLLIVAAIVLMLGGSVTKWLRP